jgi:hypothetical protein
MRERIAKLLCDKENPMMWDGGDHSFWEEKASEPYKKGFRYIADQILTLLREEIEKGLLTDEDWDRVNVEAGEDIIGMVMDATHGRITPNELMDKIAKRCDISIQAQLQKILKILEEK